MNMTDPIADMLDANSQWQHGETSECADPDF